MIMSRSYTLSVRKVSWIVMGIILLNFIQELSLFSGFSPIPFAIFTTLMSLYALKSCITSDDSIYIQKIWKVCLVLWGWGFVSALGLGGESILHPLILSSIVTNAFITYVLIKNPIKTIYFKYSFYIITGLLFLLCFVRNTDINEIFRSSGGNLISVIVLNYAVLYQYFLYRNEKKITILPSILSLMLAIYSVCRSGTICAALYFVFTLYFSTKVVKNRFYRYIILGIGLGIIGYLIIDNWELIEAWNIYEKFQGQEDNGMSLASSGRDVIWEEYFKKMTLFTFMFGTPLDESHTFDGFYNLHNSYLMLHAQVGILFFPIIYRLINSMWCLIKQNLFCASLLIVLCLRASSDICYFFAPYDFILYCFVFDKGIKERFYGKLSISLL